MAGDGDYLVKVQCSDVADYERIHRQHLAVLPGVTRLKTSFSLRTVLSTTAVDLTHRSRSQKRPTGFSLISRGVAPIAHVRIHGRNFLMKRYLVAAVAAIIAFGGFLAMAATLGGVWASYIVDTPTGPSIVVAAAAIFAVSLGVGRRAG